jgi:hypothetical protein
MNSYFYYSLRPILLFANTDVSTTKMCLHTSTLAKSIMGRRKYKINGFPKRVYIWNSRVQLETIKFPLLIFFYGAFPQIETTPLCVDQILYHLSCEQIVAFVYQVIAVLIG